MKVRELIKYLSLFNMEANVVLPANSAIGEERLTKEHIKSGLGVLIFDCVRREENERLEAVITRLINQAIRGAAENAQLKKVNALSQEEHETLEKEIAQLKAEEAKRLNDRGYRIHRQYTEIIELKDAIAQLNREKIKMALTANFQGAEIDQLKSKIENLMILEIKVKKLKELRAGDTCRYEQRLQHQRIEIQRLLKVNGRNRVDRACAKISELKKENGRLREQSGECLDKACARILELRVINSGLEKENCKLDARDRDQNAAVLLLMTENEQLDNLLRVRAEQLEERIEQLENARG